MYKLPKPVAFDWDVGNLTKSADKHGVNKKSTEEVFFNKPLKIFKDAKHSATESRYLALGVTNRGRKLSIIFTIRKNKLRVISARDQSKKERIVYEK